jgi:hypothetical protein
VVGWCAGLLCGSHCPHRHLLACLMTTIGGRVSSMCLCMIVSECECECRYSPWLHTVASRQP